MKRIELIIENITLLSNDWANVIYLENKEKADKINKKIIEIATFIFEEHEYYVDISSNNNTITILFIDPGNDYPLGLEIRDIKNVEIIKDKYTKNGINNLSNGAVEMLEQRKRLINYLLEEV